MNTKFLRDCPDWKVVHFADRAVCKSDIRYMAKYQVESLMTTQVTQLSQKGHYKVVG